MALGDNTNNKKQNYEETYYSRMRFTNYEDKKMLSFSFWKGFLKIAISDIRESATGAGIEYDEIGSIHLSPTKAHILKEQILQFRSLEDSATTNKSFGVDTGIGENKNFIAIGNKETSSEDDIQRTLFIGKVDINGNLLEGNQFNFNHKYHFGIEWKDLQAMEFDANYLDNTELDMFIVLLDQYISAMSGAIAYSVMDLGRFNNSRLNTKIELVMNKLGIETKSSKQASSESYFNKNGLGAASPENNNRARSQRTSIDDIV